MDKDTGGTVKLVIDRKFDKWTIQGWGRCQPHPCEWGVVKLEMVGKEYAFAIWDAGFANRYVTMHLDGEELVIETITLFRDASGRPNYRSVERLKRSE